MPDPSFSDRGLSVRSRRQFIGGAIATAITAAASRYIPVRAASPAVTISRGSTSSAVVALTFDAGADSGYAGTILDTLANRGVKASFGVTGKFAASYPALIKRMVNEGHSLINHSYSHASFTGTSSSTTVLTTAARVAELESTEQALVSASGRGGRPLFRPPFGDYNSSVLTDLGNAGFTHNIMWSIDVLGWNGLTKDQVINRALSNHGNGYIYLMHVGSQSQEGPALPTIIDGLRTRGYGFVTIPQMLGGGSAPPPPAATFKVGDTVKVTVNLNLRTGPGTTYSVITTMPAGTLGTVVGGPSAANGYTWYQLKTSHGTGWAASISLQLTTSAPAPTPTGYGAGTKLSVTKALYLRTAASLSSSVITTMPTGTIVTVVSGPSPSGGYSWYQVDTPYGRGWAAGEFLTPTTSAPAPAPTPPPPSTATFAVGSTAYATGAINVRSGAGLKYSVIVTLWNGAPVTITGAPVAADGYTWYPIRTGYGTLGWVAGQLLRK